MYDKDKLQKEFLYHGNAVEIINEIIKEMGITKEEFISEYRKTLEEIKPLAEERYRVNNGGGIPIPY